MKPLLLSAVWLALACLGHAGESSEPVVLGQDWFANLRNPETRLKALYQLEKATAEPDERINREEFEAEHARTLVFPCPQPGQADAWAIINTNSWEENRVRMCGLEADMYEPHPLETERRRKWDAELMKPSPDFKPWQPGQPWFGQISGSLVTPDGKLIGGFFAHPGILADFNGDGMLDLIQIERVHTTIGKNNKKDDSLMDAVSVGPLDPERDRFALLCCNRRPSDHETPRTWRFAVRKNDDGGLMLALVPLDKKQPEIAFHFRNGTLVPAADGMPDTIYLDTHPKGESWEAVTAMLEKHGLRAPGFGSDDACEVTADFPLPPERFDFDDRPIFALPETGALPPRDAAQVLVRQVLGDAFYRSQYEVASVGDPAPPATRGWLENWNDGGGWGTESVVVWWFNGDTAERWEQSGATFLVSRLPAAELGRSIAVAHELDRVRTVPVSPFSVIAPHRSNGGDDIPIARIRAMTREPELRATVYQASIPQLWGWIGPQYDRGLASLIATLHFTVAKAGGEPRDLRELAPVWLDPKQVSNIPPGLAKAAVVAIGDQRWKEMKPLLVKLNASLGPLSDGEKRLARIAEEEAEWYQRRPSPLGIEESLANRKHNAMECEKRELMVKLTGDVRFELRQPIAEALRKLAEAK